MTKGSGTMLFVADSTRERMRDEGADLVLVGELEVRGREENVRVWTLPPARAGEAEGEEGGTAEGAQRQPAG